jgi:hypothetical protein
MRRGLDFAWSRPGVDAILAGGFTFVLRYLSYDTTGKNLTRKEADTYRARGVDVVSNWEYSTTAALNGRGQGQRDAIEARRQHAACGGDPNAPIYFSVDFDATPGQQAAIDEYLRGAADVVGVARVGVYGGYWVVKRCLDNGTARWGWQTYAWSGGLWDPRAAIRQVQNGVRVGGADCDINTAMAANFGQWFASGVNPSPGPLPGPPEEESDMPKFFHISDGPLAGTEGITNGPTWYAFPDPVSRDAAFRIWGVTAADMGPVAGEHVGGLGQRVPFPGSASSGGSASGPVDLSAKALDDVEKRVDRQLDQQSLAGADKD